MSDQLGAPYLNMAFPLTEVDLHIDRFSATVNSSPSSLTVGNRLTSILAGIVNPPACGSFDYHKGGATSRRRMVAVFRPSDELPAVQGVGSVSPAPGNLPR
jgi:hypothetical protein